jgi:hypothetical protein
MDFLTKHFLPLSFIVVIASAAFSMVVLTSYLTVFDWNLVWLVEYSDITKLSLIGVAFVSSTATLIINQTLDAYAWIVKGSKLFRNTIFGVAAINLAVSAYAIYNDIRTSNGHEAYHSLRAITLFVFLGALFILFRSRDRILRSEFYATTNFIGAIVILLGSLGATYGYYVRDVSKETREIWTSNEKFLKSKIIMLLSHHVAFLANDKVVVLPTQNIERIISDKAR